MTSEIVAIIIMVIILIAILIRDSQWFKDKKHKRRYRK